MIRYICLLFVLSLLSVGAYFALAQSPPTVSQQTVAEPAFTQPGALPTTSALTETLASPRVVSAPASTVTGTQPVVRRAAPVLRLSPLSVAIAGPPDAIRGDQLVFNALISGDAVSMAWTVFRINDDGTLSKLNGLITLPSDRVAFSNRTIGLYLLTCTVVGRDFTPLTAEHQFEIIDGNTPQPQPPAPTDNGATDDHASDNPAVDPNAPPMPPQPQPQPQQPQQQIVGLVDIVAQLVNVVRSPNPLAEAKIVGGSFRQVANLASTGRLPAGTNLIAEVYKQAAIDLGQSAPAWTPFFQALEAGVKNPDANFLSQVASILAGMQ